MRTAQHRARVTALLAVLGTVVISGVWPAQAQAEEPYFPISGAGSTWSQNALDQWIRNVSKLYGMKVNYAGTGSSDGRNQFRVDSVDFAVSEIPYGLKDGGVVDQPPSRPYAYMPIVAGGTSFMYNLKIGGQRVTNLRLSGATIAKIFSGTITKWNDPAIKADNPSLALPAQTVVPVVRSDGSGTTAQLTTWLSKRHADVWNAYCKKAGRATPCGVTSFFPVVKGSAFVSQSGSTGVAGYVKQAQSEGSITYVEYSYAQNAKFPVAKMLNKAGYYSGPTAQNVAVGLLGAKIAADLTQQLDGVYDNPDPRAYPLSSYSYMVLPTATTKKFTEAKGRTLARFANYFLCEGQQLAPKLGYSPLPINLVQAGIKQVNRIPGRTAQNIDIKTCNNPTFSKDGSNTLAKTAPQPPACDKQGPTQCAPGSTTAAPAVGGSGTSGGSGSGGSTSGGSGADPAAGGTVDPATGEVPTEEVVDPETGEVVGTAADGQQVSGVPVALAASQGWGTDDTLVVMAVALVIALVLAPPLLARALALRRDQ